MKDLVENSVAYYDPDACDLQDFTALIDQTTQAVTVPHAVGVEKNIPIYDVSALEAGLEEASSRREIMAEWARVLRTGAGAVVLKGTYADTGVLDEATGIFEQIIFGPHTQFGFNDILDGA